MKKMILRRGRQKAAGGRLRSLVPLLAIGCLLLSAYCFPPSVAAQSATTVADTIHAPDGSLPSGKIVISASSTFTAADGSVVFHGTVATATVTNGAFSVALIPNAGSTPSGTSYTAIYELSGVPYRNETWVVPASATPVNLAAVRSATLGSPSQMVSASQLPGLTGDVNSSAGSSSASVVGLHFGSTALAMGTAPSDGQCLTRSGFTITGASCGASSFSGLSGTLDPATQLGAGSGAVNIAAGGANQNITLMPSGTGGVGIGTTSVGSTLTVSSPGGMFWGTGAGGITVINSEATQNTGGWRITEGYPTANDGYLMFMRSTSNTPAFMLTNNGNPVFNASVQMGNGYSFGSASLGGMSYYEPFNGSNNSILSFANAPTGAEFLIQGYYEPSGSWVRTSFLEMRDNASPYIQMDVPVEAQKSVSSGFQSVAFTSPETYDASAANTFETTLTGNITSFAITNPTVGETARFIWIQDSTGGWAVSGAPTNVWGFTTPGTTAGTRSVQSCTYDGTDWTCEPAAVNLTHP